MEEAEIIQQILKGYLGPESSKKIYPLKEEEATIYIDIAPESEPVLDLLLSRNGFSEFLRKEQGPHRSRIAIAPRPKSDNSRFREFTFLGWKLYERLKTVINNTEQTRPVCIQAMAMAVWACEIQVDVFPYYQAGKRVLPILNADQCHKLLQ